MCACSHLWLKMRKIVHIIMKILPYSAFSKSPKEQMLCAFGENNPHRAFYLSRHRCMMLKNFLSFLKPKAGFSSCKKQIGLSFIDVFLKCQAQQDRVVVVHSVGHTQFCATGDPQSAACNCITSQWTKIREKCKLGVVRVIFCESAQHLLLWTFGECTLRKIFHYFQYHFPYFQPNMAACAHQHPRCR